MLGDLPRDCRLGAIDLLPHQLSALRRLTQAIDRFNGALLCDEVGMGKTYVALAVARAFPRRLIVAPAALLSMWQSALAAAAIDADIVSFERLSRSDVDAFRREHEPNPSKSSRRNKNASKPPQDPRTPRYDLIVVDEAHHVRNPRTNRYFALENLVRGAKVLLLTATPIHNHRDDIVALLSLFLGSRARAMTSWELAQCEVRREHKQLAGAVRIPTVKSPTAYHVSDDPRLVALLMNLPPPVPLRDGGIATALIGRGLVHQWASSEAALREAVRRRIARAIALCASLEAGTYPTVAELQTWAYEEGALQLGFAELLSDAAVTDSSLAGGVRAHLAALESIKARFRSIGSIDIERANIVMAIRNERRDRRIVAFAQYAETVAVIYRRLAKSGCVAMLTSHGGRVAGGPLTRTEAIGRFAPVATGRAAVPRAEAIELLLTTDLLSEGVNLQDADTVIHLDIPWTAARMEQRVGRVARLGSRRAAVEVHLIHPPASAAALLDIEDIVRRKWTAARINIGTSRIGPLPNREAERPASVDDVVDSATSKTERLRTLFEGWRQAHRVKFADSTSGLASSSIPVAVAASETAGFIAAVSVDGISQLVVSAGKGPSVFLDDQLEVCHHAEPPDAGADRERISKRDRREIANADKDEISAVLDTIDAWLIAQRAAAAAGVSASNALKRRELISRIDSLIESAPPHVRSTRLSLAARARNVVTTPQCAAVERELHRLLDLSTGADEWLAAVADVGVQEANSPRSAAQGIQIHAVLLLSVKPPRSR